MFKKTLVTPCAHCKHTIPVLTLSQKETTLKANETQVIVCKKCGKSNGFQITLKQYYKVKNNEQL
jgi:RNase P subunit RPR2